MRNCLNNSLKLLILNFRQNLFSPVWIDKIKQAVLLMDSLFFDKFVNQKNYLKMKTQTIF